MNIGAAEGQPLLILAIARGDLVTLDLLLNAGADVNIRDTNSNPALMSAIANSQYPAAIRLVEHGASVNVKGPKWAGINLAALYGRTDLCQVLLEAGASIDQLGDSSHSALMLACQEEHVETVSLLLELGADPNPKNAKGLSPSTIAPSRFIRESAILAFLKKFGGR